MKNFNLKKLFLCVLLNFCFFSLNANTIKNGIVKYKTGRLKESEKIFKKIYNENTNEKIKGTAFYYLIQIQNDLQKRKIYYQIFVNNFKKHELYKKVCYELATVYMNEEKYVKAEILLQSIKAGSYLEQNILLRLGRIAVKKNDFTKALDIFTKFIKLYPRSKNIPGAIYFKGKVYLKLKMKKQAVSQFLKILEKFPKESEAASSLYNLGEISYQSEDYRMSYDYFGKLVRRFPNSFEAYIAKGRLRILRSHFVKSSKVKVFEIQLAVYYSKKYAHLYVNKLKKKGIKSFIYRNTAKKKIMYSVRVGFFKDKRDAKIMLKKLKKNKIEGFIRTRTVVLPEDYFGK